MTCLVCFIRNVNELDVSRKRIQIRERKRHTSELPDGRNCTLLNLHSVTEQTNIEEFTEIAFAAENKFNSGLYKIKIVDLMNMTKYQMKKKWLPFMRK
ncbi:hypothetical protein CEXT_730941 [Caerostris extrusa]|uniref:Uncharacterized protein n=1 Tax=Caerostris extrusa TaxID=172846 RepID=A0AAV4TQ49_CAEEX|nr:hypothetical protein CEXT_730941 [Caerostris extrusa]